MLARIQSFMLIGIDPRNCEIEVDVSQRGMAKTTIVGLAQMAVKESIERVRRSIINCGYSFPAHALLINLAPADVKKEAARPIKESIYAVQQLYVMRARRFEFNAWWNIRSLNDQFVQHQCRIEHGARHRTGCPAHVRRIDRHPAKARLETEQAA